MDDQGSKGPRGEVFTKTIRAGKRTYFFDVKTTRSNEFYLTITESKKRFNQQSGKFYYEKHKLFLYPEDFDKFTDALKESFSFIETSNPEDYTDESEKPGFDDVKFEDLDKEKTEKAKEEPDEQKEDKTSEESTEKDEKDVKATDKDQEEDNEEGNQEDNDQGKSESKEEEEEEKKENVKKEDKKDKKNKEEDN